jgi:ABC-type glycerol-3-phosphate transport system substrate-binding protein
MIRTRMLAAFALLALSTGVARADCAFQNDVPLSVMTAAFDAWKAVTDAMAECGNITAELSQEFQDKQAQGFAAQPSLYHIGGVSNSSLVPLVDGGLIRPLDELVSAYGQGLAENQLIRVDGQIVAVAMMVNAQHLMYRKDILADLGLAVPTTWDEVVAAAEAIKAAGVVDYPLGGTWKTTWLEFVNLFLGYGGTPFGEGFVPAINSEAGVKALEMMAAMMPYMDPEVLSADSTYVQQQFQQGRIAMANLWSSRAGAMDNPDESQVVGLIGLAAAPLAGDLPASTLWWDGIVIAANIPDAEAETAFRVAMEGMDAQMAAANPDAAIWIIPGATPGDLATGAAATAEAGALAFPASVPMGLLQTAIQDNIPAFLTGQSDAATTLAAIEDAYRLAATEAGILQ